MGARIEVAASTVKVTALRPEQHGSISKMTQRRFETWSGFAAAKIVSVVMLKVGAFQALNSSR